MDNFIEYLSGIENQEHANKLKEVLEFILNEYPQLDTRIAWKQPMFTFNGTFIIGFSVSKEHFDIAIEKEAKSMFASQIKQAGYIDMKMLFKIRFDQEVDYELLKEMIDYKLIEKKEHKKFWK